VGRDSPGDDDRWLPIDDQENGYYNYRLMHFRAEGDLVRYPDYVWSSAGYWAARGGLGVHLEEVAERHEGVLYSDILVLLNRDDLQRANERLVTPWEDQLQAMVDEQVQRMIDERGWRLAVPDRPVRVRVVGDGEPAMGGQPLGLGEGEFATAMLPNLYHGPTVASRPIAEVFVRIPRAVGGRGGFRSVGTFYDDQLAFTIGRHWLDNGQLPELPVSALYTLHRFPGHDAVNHRLNADLADSYRLLRTTSSQGESVLVHHDDSSSPVMEVMLVQAAPTREQADELAGGEAGTGGTLIPDELPPIEGMTMMPEPEAEPAVILSRRGVLLQKPHFRGVMRGYRLDIGLDGSVAPMMPEPACRFRVEDDQVFLEPLRRDVTLDGAPLRMGRRTELPGPEHRIAFANVALTWRSGDRTRDERWPYLGEVTVPAEPLELPMGSAFRIGRDRRKCEIALPDRAINENILWDPSVSRSGAIRTRAGEVPVESFTTDSIMVAGRHAEIDLRGSEPKVRALSRACPVFVRRRSGAVLRLIARDGATAQPLLLGDDLLIGNSLFRVILPAIGDEATPDPQPEPGSASNSGGTTPEPTPEPGGYSGEEAASVSLDEPLPASDAGPDRPPLTDPDPPPEDPVGPVYGAVPRALRRRGALPARWLAQTSLDETLTVIDH
jgi:hypothetical protein